MSRNSWILLALSGSLALLAGAYVFQALGYAPCKLCLWQRWPHMVAIVVGGLALVLRSWLLPVAGALASATTGAIGIYHTGVERGFWEGPTTCSAANDISRLSAADLLAQINSAPLIRCDEVAWDLFTLSMASWNAVASFALVAIWLIALRARA